MIQQFGGRKTGVLARSRASFEKWQKLHPNKVGVFIQSPKDWHGLDRNEPIRILGWFYEAWYESAKEELEAHGYLCEYELVEPNP